MESQGLPAVLDEETVITRFNDPDRLRDDFRKYGDRAACFLVEPFIGAGGFIPATRDYLLTARELTQRHGAALILDEVISGFRFRAGDMGALYGVQPDLAIFGKVMGGGMPVAAVAGRAEIMGLSGHGAAFTGGTFSGHPASMLAAKTILEYLIAHEAEVYPRLAALGERTRQTAEAAFAEEGVYARCTGYPNDALPGSSMAMCHFPYEEDRALRSPEDVDDPAVCDVALKDKVLQLALLLENVYVVHGLGALSVAHTEADIVYLGEACRRAARRIQPYV
jgi:glutamate-1-semialdehyde 2,1-aminomutase